MVGVFWGVVFVLVFYGLSRAGTIAAGIAWGVVVWITTSALVLPALGLGQLAAAEPAALAVMEHVVFGVAIAVTFLPFQREAFVLPRRRRFG